MVSIKYRTNNHNKKPMKKLLISISILAFVGCKKQFDCWTCEFYPVNGYTEPVRKVCTQKKPTEITDSLNNPLPFNCYK